MACNFRSVLKSANECKENPAGVSNYCMIVPFSSVKSGDGFISEVTVNDDKNQYTITPSGSGENLTLKGYKVEFKNQTGQVTSEDNGTGKGWSGSATGRVEMGEDLMAFTSRILHNSDKNLYFIPTGKKVDGKSEFIVIGNENGEAEIQVTFDTGAARTDDHGSTFTVTCPYMLYPVTKWVGTIEQEDAA